MENKILEELKRIKLLSNYDSKLTLSENYSILDEREIVSEQNARAFIKQGGTQFAKTVAKDIDAIINSFRGGLKNVDNVALKSGDDVVRAIKAGKLAPAELGKVNMGLFRITKDAGLKSAIARDISSTASFGKTMSSVKTEREAINALMNGPKKFTQEEAKLLVKEFKTNGGVIGKRTAQQTTTSTITRPKKRTRKPTSKENSFGSWKSRMGARWSSMSRTQKILAIAGAGLGIYLLWNYFKSEEPGIFTDCVLGFMSDEDLELMAQKGFGDGIIITDVPNRQVAALGGVKLFTNGSLETVTGGVKGTWKDNGTSISVTIDGETYEIPCASTGGGEGVGETTPDPTTRYRDCGAGPFSKGCSETDVNGPIHKLQSCLGVVSDGKFWTKTEAALMSVHSKKSVTTDEINTICNQSNTDDTLQPDNNSGNKPTDSDSELGDEVVLSTDSDF